MGEGPARPPPTLASMLQMAKPGPLAARVTIAVGRLGGIVGVHGQVLVDTEPDSACE